jgi:hypothetical protein
MPRVNTTVELNPMEQAVCMVLAMQRYANNRAAGTRNAKRGGQSNLDTDLEGIAAEFAFCKLFNLYPDLSMERPKADEDLGDCTLKDGRGVDVKGTKYKTGKLIAVPWKKGKAPLFALMVGTFPKYTFKGFMPADELLREERLGSLGHGPTYIADQAELVAFVLPVVDNEPFVVTSN